jgi:hypothetical protein
MIESNFDKIFKSKNIQSGKQKLQSLLNSKNYLKASNDNNEGLFHKSDDKLEASFLASESPLQTIANVKNSNTFIEYDRIIFAS